MRAQTAAEYVTLIALIFVLVGALMLVGFRQQEINLALAGARLGCNEYSSANYNGTCYEIRYYYVGLQNVTIVPYAPALSTPTEKNALRDKIVSIMGRTFRPNIPATGECVRAAYYSYCVLMP